MEREKIAVCKLCKRPFTCDECHDTGEILVSYLRHGKTYVDCPDCNGLHPKCHVILNEYMDNWERQRDAKEITIKVRTFRNGV